MRHATRWFPRFLSYLLCALFAASCEPADHPGESIDCPDGRRILLDCSSEVAYQGASGTAGISVMDVVEAHGAFEEKAIRRVSDQVQEFVVMHTRACQAYNGCVLDAEQYRAEANDIQKRIMLLPTLVEALKSAKSESERARILDQLYRGVVPDGKRVEEVTFELGVSATIPADLGGGTLRVAPGDLVPTGARLKFVVSVSADAYVYMFQSTPSSEVSVLFPDARIGTNNPLRASVSAEIPPGGQSFLVDSSDIGTEHVYIVVSRQRLANLDAALDRVKAGQVSTIAQDRLLQNVATVDPLGSASACQSRALVLDGAPGPCAGSRGLQLVGASTTAGTSAAGPSVTVRTSPGDDLIVQAFPFQHVTEESYRAARRN